MKRRLEGAQQPERSLLGDLSAIAARPIDAAGFVMARYLRLRSLVKSVSFEVIAEPAPDPESRVTLSLARDRLGMPRARVAWRLSDQVKRTFDRTLGLVAEELTGAGVAEVALDPPFERNGWPATFAKEGCWHHIGTTRMHDSPSSGVVDADCRSTASPICSSPAVRSFPPPDRIFPRSPWWR